MSWIISATPSITCSRRITVPPSRIRSATERPSRAPSTTKSVISATASGWLSLTPRSSRRRATLAAMATSSLSFSRGVRFIACVSPSLSILTNARPELHQACQTRLISRPRRRRFNWNEGGPAPTPHIRLYPIRSMQPSIAAAPCKGYAFGLRLQPAPSIAAISLRPLSCGKGDDMGWFRWIGRKLFGWHLKRGPVPLYLRLGTSRHLGDYQFIGLCALLLAAAALLLAGTHNRPAGVFNGKTAPPGAELSHPA